MAAIIAIGAPKPEKPQAATMTLPLDAISMDGAEPEVGDEVSHSITGKVTRISGDMATIRVTELDGAPVEGSPEEEAGESPEEEAGEEGAESGGPSGSGPGGPAPPPGVPPELAALMAGRSKARAATAAMGRGLRKRARGRPMPMM
jgi:hypothetical protein